MVSVVSGSRVAWVPSRQLYDESMSLAKQEVHKLIDIYLRDATSQDPDLMLTVVTPTASYHERVLQRPISDRWREYWVSERVSC